MGPGDFTMRRVILRAALVAAALTGSDAALAQNVAAPAAEAAPPPAQSASGPIAALQEQLKREGYMPGPVNGVMTEQTRRALADYARRTGRPPAALASAAPGNPAADPVRRAQAGLQRLGLFAGPVDGTVGPQTRDAIIRFEAARRLAIDPRVSDRLLAELDQADANPGTAPVAAPAAAATATGQTTPAEARGRRPLPSGINPPAIR